MAKVVAVCRKASHGVGKRLQLSIRLVEGRGVEGDAHFGETIKHRSRVGKTNPDPPNTRQVHLIHEELFAELAAKGFHVGSGDMGENVTTRGLDLLALPTGARLRLGETALVEITGLRNPCLQLDGIKDGLMQAVLEKTPGGLVRKAGVMGIVLAGGELRPGDAIAVTLPDGPPQPLKPV